MKNVTVTYDNGQAFIDAIVYSKFNRDFCPQIAKVEYDSEFVENFGYISMFRTTFQSDELTFLTIDRVALRSLPGSDFSRKIFKSFVKSYCAKLDSWLAQSVTGAKIHDACKQAAATDALALAATDSLSLMLLTNAFMGGGCYDNAEGMTAFAAQSNIFFKDDTPKNPVKSSYLKIEKESAHLIQSELDLD